MPALDLVVEPTEIGRHSVVDVPRRRSARQRMMLWRTAALIFAGGLAIFAVIERQPRGEEPLAFFLEEESAGASGLQLVHAKPAFHPYFENVWPLLKAVSASACVTDVDGDERLDLYLTTSGTAEKNRLFLNRGGFRFVAADIPAIEDLNHDGFSADCTFADVDNDGFDDLFVATVGQRPRLFLNEPADDGVARTFVDVTEGSGLADYMNGFAAAFFDVERDGDLDLVTASYFGERYREGDVPGRPRVHPTRVPPGKNVGRVMPNHWVDADNGGEKRFFLNDGHGRFVEQSLDQWGLAATRFTFDVGTGDVNGDGFADLYFANDYGPDQLYLNRGGRFFEDVDDALPTGVGRAPFKGMSAELVDVDHDSYPEIFVAGVLDPALPGGNALWHNRPHPSGDPFMRSFANIAADVGVRDGGWGFAARVVDLDLDGDVDVLATSGYLSQSSERARWYRVLHLVASAGELVVDSARWPDLAGASLGGHQRSRVFVNEGGRFYDRAAELGVTRSFDGRGVVIADFDVDGRPDVLWVPQGAPSLLARNRFVATRRTPAPPSWIGLRLAGDGALVPKKPVGARVKVSPTSADDARAFTPRFLEVSAGNGIASQSMDWLLFGLGEYRGDVDAEIRWSNGQVEQLSALAPGRYHDVRFQGRSAP